MLENGAPVGAILVNFGTGYKNGASIAYVLYLIAILFSFYLSKKFIKSLIAANFKVKFHYNNENFYKSSIIILALNSIFFLTIFYLFGGYRVLFLGMEKAVFRSTLGFFGSLAYSVSFVFAPVLLSYLTLIYLNAKKKSITLIIANYLIVVLIGLCWGFKTSALYAILPGLLVVFWKLNILKLILLLVFTGSMLYGTATYFHPELDINSLFMFLLARMTIFQGEVPWYIWDRVIIEDINVNYFKTLLAAFGGKSLEYIGNITRGANEEWISYNYGLILAQLCGYGDAGIETGSGVTGTVFSEGLIALGQYGFWVFGIIAGIVIRVSYELIDLSIKKNNSFMYSLFSVYFAFYVLSWLSSGGIVFLFHISTVVNIIICVFLLALVRSLSSENFRHKTQNNN